MHFTGRGLFTLKTIFNGKFDSIPVELFQVAVAWLCGTQCSNALKKSRTLAETASSNCLNNSVEAHYVRFVFDSRLLNVEVHQSDFQ